MTSENPIQRSDGDLLRMLGCVIAMTALGGALWSAIKGVDCEACGKASAMVANLPVAWAGAAFYVILVFVAAASGFSRWTRRGFVFASGIHFVLLAVLVKEKLFCVGCVTAGSAALVGGAISLLVKPRPGRWTAVLFAFACVLTLGGLLAARQVQLHRVEAMIQPATQVAKGRVTLVLYLREGCWHCMDFEERILTPLLAEMGDFIDVTRLEAEPAMVSPTIQVVGKSEERLFVGGVGYEELVKAIEEVR